MERKDSLKFVKPLAGNCDHEWLEQESPFLVAQLCKHCRLYRYKVAAIADWEYRAPIPRAAFGSDIS